MKILSFILTFLTTFFSGVIVSDLHFIRLRRIRIKDCRIRKDVRFLVFSDLHGREFGKGNRRLVEKVRALKPDFILTAGDIMTAKDFGSRIQSSVDVASDLIRQLTEICPVYFALGNHESRVQWNPELFEFDYDWMLKRFRDAGAILLDNDNILLEKYGIRIYGLSLRQNQYNRFRRSRHLYVGTLSRMIGKADGKHYSILLAHNPEYLPTYAAWGADLTFSGHYHGGIMRLPLIGGVISPRPSLFPRYSGGMYRLRGRHQYVLCGIGVHSVPIRVFNPAELVSVELHH